MAAGGEQNGGRHARELGDRLEQLKTVSGLSYDRIGRKVHVSKSAVHRYCRGTSVPREFGIVERIALACGASRDEMAVLYGLWSQATTPHTDVDERIPAAALDAERPLPTKHVRSRRRPAWALVAVVLIVVVPAAVLVGSTAGGARFAAGGPAHQSVEGPAWTLPPARVKSELFGVTINSATGAMPAFRVGAVRFWDGGTRWSELQRQRGEFDWTTLDRLVGGAEKAGLPPMFVFGSTPRWASPNGQAGPYPDGTSAPPSDLVDWDLFVRAVAERYRGRIEAYELWVLANDRRFYTGSIEVLVEMTRRASQIIRATDPSATVVCPGMGRLQTEEGLSFLRRFVELNGYDHCDVAGIKLFRPNASDPPEAMLNLTTAIDRVMHDAGVHPRLWSTGTDYSIATQPQLDEVTARNYAVRFFLVGMFAREVNLERLYFYNWGGTKIPIVLQPVGGVPTTAALAVEQLQRWLHNASIRSCGKGLGVNLPANVFECVYTVTDSGQTFDATIRWTDRGTAAVSAPRNSYEVWHLDGPVKNIQAGDTLMITEEPVLIASNPTAPR
ncbi:helix-turn-helix domain-containing protein [Lentzea aerocolonigenes]|uniref:helix-turn-helix domain-containing protein n=1 Tax=Lentzea aerocolonigenes TaxID=68170 RepID=UPI000689F489|nr:helix-turn-helix domain-containing protein [Lentzea aerocolonigenes]MCP2242671.1 Helix-turn-helix domain-containing protein [Lentzea aerocolonigenes]